MAKHKVNYQIGALKRKYKLGRGDVEPGTFINKINQKTAETKEVMLPTKEKVAMMGMV